MASQAIATLIGQLENDLPRSALFRKKVPALAKAFDAERMKSTLQEVLFGAGSVRYSILSCVPGKALYLPDDVINLQYKLTIQDGVEGELIPGLLNARLFPELSACRAYLQEALLPIAARMDGRPEIAAFTRPVAMIEELKMVLSAFPIDGEIPTLVDATDSRTIARMFSETLPEAVSGEFEVHDVRLLLAHYGRFQRCVLRYSIQGLDTSTQAPASRTAYGKVDADGMGDLTVAILAALRERLQEPGLPYRFRIPHALAYDPELKLLIMEALPGQPFFKDLLRTWSGNRNPDRRGGVDPSPEADAALEHAVRTCALIAATLHSSAIPLGPHNTLEKQIASLRDEADVLSHVFPELGTQFGAWIDEVVEFARAYPAMPACFSHGDFTYTQLIFDGSEGGLVDFDSICQAEPAQDLGQYLAYQRLNIIKDQDPKFPFASEAIEYLCDLFLNTYLAVSRSWIPDESLLRGRVAIYELVSLTRLALHSWEKLKGSRLKQTLALLEERIQCQRQVRSSVKDKTA
jgi:hypothetical protein